MSGRFKLMREFNLRGNRICTEGEHWCLQLRGSLSSYHSRAPYSGVSDFIKGVKSAVDRHVQYPLHIAPSYESLIESY